MRSAWLLPGLLLGLAKRRNIDAIALLAETYGHPMYLGVKGAREILSVLNQKFSLELDINQLDKEISEMEEESSRRRSAEVKKLPQPRGKAGDVTYIG